MLLLLVGLTAAQQHFVVLFQHRVWNPDGVYGSRGDLVLYDDSSATMKWRDVTRASVTLGSAHNGTAAFGVNIGVGQSILAVDFATAALSVVCTQQKNATLYPDALWGKDGRFGSKEVPTDNSWNGVTYSFGQVDFQGCALVESKMSSFSVNNLRIFKSYTSVFAPDHSTFYHIGIFNGGSGQLLAYSATTKLLTATNVTCLKWQPALYSLNAFYSMADQALYIVTEVIYTTYVYRVPLASMECELVLSFSPANAEIQGVSFDDASGLIFFGDGYQGFGVMNVRTKKTWTGSFNWFYNTNSIFTSAITSA